MWDDSKMPGMKFYTVNSAPPYVCPVCSEKSMHLYLNRYKNTKHGGAWNWCDKCHSYSHASCLIPGWWKNLDIIEQNRLFHSPEYLNEHRVQIDEWVGNILKKRVMIDDLEYYDEIFKDTYYNDKPFTGTAIDIGEDGSYEEWNFIDGFGEGPCFGYYPNGRYEYYCELSHGVETVEKEWTKDGTLITDNQTDPMVRREYYENGALRKEVKDEHLRLWYPNGNLKEEFIVADSIVTYYAPDGTWHTKMKNDGFPIVFDETKMEFNDRYIREHYLELLEDHEGFYPFFIRWLPKKQESNDYALSSDLSEIICSLIASNNPEFKYNGINLAADYRVTDAIPLLEKEIVNRTVPKGGDNHGYADTVGKRARIALKQLTKRD